MVEDLLQRKEETMRYVYMLAIALCFILAVKLAHAKWDGERLDQVQTEWFAAQHNKQGQWCCDKADGHWYDSNYTFNEDGSVTLADGHKIAPYMVLDNPNPTGRAVYWHSDYGTDYCFAPGMLS